MSPALTIARRELRGGLRGFRVFLVCLVLGTAAIAAVGTVRDAIFAGLLEQGATILGGDVSVRLTYRRAEAAERAWLDAAAPAVSEVIEFRSMAVAGDGAAAERALTEVKAVDGAWPLYGAPVLDPPLPLDEVFAIRDGRPGAAMDRVLAERLGLAPGDGFRLGAAEFVLAAILVREPDSSLAGIGFGPRTLVRTPDLLASGLLAPGTLFEAEYRLRLAPGTDPAAPEQAAAAALDTTGWRWRTAAEAGRGVGRFVDRLSAFLTLVGLAGLAVGGVGVALAVRSYLAGKRATIATLRTLGAGGRTVLGAYALQIGALAGAGIAGGLLLGGLLPVALGPLIEARLPMPAAIELRLRPLAEAALYGALAAALFTLWPLAGVEGVRAAALYRAAALGGAGWPRWPWLAAMALLATALVGAAAALSGLPFLALWTAGGIALAFAALLGAAALLGRLARRLARARTGGPVLRPALAALGGPGGETAPVVVAIGLGLSVLAAVGQVQVNLRDAVLTDLPGVAPAYFVLDIQPDQIDAFGAVLAADPGVERVETAPMLRGVVTAINGVPADRLPPHWVLRGDRGLTYSDAPPPRTEVVAGAWWPAGHDGPPQMSFAAEEAREIGLALGDTVTVDVLGRAITAEVTSFREVDFSSAGLGFVMAMNPAALQGAPHSHIATIYAAPEAEGRVLRAVAEPFPNVTLIPVREAIDRAAEILGQIARAVTWAAGATLLIGAVVLVGAAAAGEERRAYEAAVLKVLGATRPAILASFALRSALLGAAAGIVAVAAGAAAGWGVMRFVMEGEFRFAAGSALAIVLVGIGLTLATGAAFAWRSLSVRPARLLRAAD